MGLIADVKTLLTGVTNIYLGDMPDSPDAVVGIYNTGGHSRSLSGSMVREPTFMIKVRHTSYATGETLCYTIQGLLHGVNNKAVGSTTRKFLLIEQQGDINDLGRDEKNRPNWSLNFRAYYSR